jgi:hypothetical protein
MKRSKAAKRSRKTAKKKRTKPDDKEAATTFVPAAIPESVETPVPAAPQARLRSPHRSAWPGGRPPIGGSRSTTRRLT